MPHHCTGHSHGEPNIKADAFTNLTTGIGSIADFLSTLYFFASLVDTFGETEIKFAGMSYQSMAIAGAMSLLLTVCSTVCHRELNKKNQTEQPTTPSETREESDVTRVLIDPPHTAPDQHTHSTKKAFLLYLLLSGDLISHASGIASPLMFIAFYAMKMDKAAKAGAFAATTLLGIIGSIASVRTCKNAMFENTASRQDNHGHSHGEHDHHHDDDHAHSHGNGPCGHGH